MSILINKYVLTQNKSIVAEIDPSNTRCFNSVWPWAEVVSSFSNHKRRSGRSYQYVIVLSCSFQVRVRSTSLSSMATLKWFVYLSRTGLTSTNAQKVGFSGPKIRKASTRRYWPVDRSIHPRNRRTTQVRPEVSSCCLKRIWGCVVAGYAYYGEYPLAFAACFGNEEMYDFLLEHGGDPNLQDTFGNTVLHMMVICNQIVREWSSHFNLSLW